MDSRPIYVIGDIQGCFDELMKLLSIIPSNSQVFLAGDIVNRGNKSLKTIKWCERTNASSVIGNHDLHLISSFLKLRKNKNGDTIEKILQDEEVESYIYWLRRQPFVRELKQGNDCAYLVHAGFWHGWDIQEVLELSFDLSQALLRDSYKKLIKDIYMNCPSSWESATNNYERLIFAANVFTRIRFCERSGTPYYKYDSAPSEAPSNMIPWFKVQGRKTTNCKIIGGHWSTMGLFVSEAYTMLDTGAVYGGKLTAMRVFGEENILQVESKKYSDL